MRASDIFAMMCEGSLKTKHLKSVKVKDLA